MVTSWFKRRSALPVTSGTIENLLGANTDYEGTIRSDGNIRIDGVFRGRIETAGNVLIGPSAKVLADIAANIVQVWGSVQGNIKTQGRLEILANGRVWGDIEVGSLLIDEGGMFRGRCTMAGEDIEEIAAMAQGASAPAEAEPLSEAEAEPSREKAEPQEASPAA